jgi:OHCU decarboxylase
MISRRRRIPTGKIWSPLIGSRPSAGIRRSAKRPRLDRSPHGGGRKAKLAQGNRAYRERFGYIFIVCATGKSAEEMLALLEQRLQNDPAHELRIAAEQQRLITRLRLEKLLTVERSSQ